MTPIEFTQYLKTGTMNKGIVDNGSQLVPEKYEYVDKRLRYRFLRLIGFKRAGISIVNLHEKILAYHAERRMNQFAVNQLSNREQTTITAEQRYPIDELKNLEHIF